MGRIFQTSTPKPARTVGPSSLHQSRGKGRILSKPTNSKAGYQSFYNIQKTRLSARCPFLPSKQIERRIKGLWENASAEKRASFCLTLSGTTPAKSPFRGTILKGLLRKIKPLEDQIIGGGGRLHSNHGVENEGVVDSAFASPPSIKHRQALTPRHGILKSSEKKRMSASRVSFSLDRDAALSPICAYQHPRRRVLENGHHHQSPVMDTASLGRPLDTPKGEPFTEQIGFPKRALAKELNDAEGDREKPHDAPAKQMTDTVSIAEVVCDYTCSSTVDVNVVEKMTVNASNRKTSSQKVATNVESMDTQRHLNEGIGSSSEVPIKGVGDNHGAEAVLSTPVRWSRRAAAIAAKTKIQSPVANKERMNHLKNTEKEIVDNKKQEASSKNCTLYRLKKTTLSLEEEKMYEFEDEDTSLRNLSLPIGKGSLGGGSRMTTRPRLRRLADGEAKDQEEYNLDSNVNQNVFTPESQTPTLSPEPVVQSSGKGEESRGRPGKGIGTTCKVVNGEEEMRPERKRGRPRKSTVSSGERGDVQSAASQNVAKRKRGRPRKAVQLEKTLATTLQSGKGGRKMTQKKLLDYVNDNGFSMKDDESMKLSSKAAGRGRKSVPKTDAVNLDNNNMDAKCNDENGDDDGRRKVPWMVSACPSSSSDEAQDDYDDDDGDEAVYQRYHDNGLNDAVSSLPSSSSSTPLLSSSQESQELISSSQKVCESFEMFCRGSLGHSKDVVYPKIKSVESLQSLSSFNGDMSSEDRESSSSVTSIDAAEVMSISTECSISQGTSSSELTFPANLKTAFPEFPKSLGSRPKPGLSRKQMMRLQDGECTDSSSQASDGDCNGAEERYGRGGVGGDTKQDPMRMVAHGPTGRKRKMRGQEGESIDKEVMRSEADGIVCNQVMVAFTGGKKRKMKGHGGESWSSKEIVKNRDPKADAKCKVVKKILRKPREVVSDEKPSNMYSQESSSESYTERGVLTEEEEDVRITNGDDMKRSTRRRHGMCGRPQMGDEFGVDALSERGKGLMISDENDGDMKNPNASDDKMTLMNKAGMKPPDALRKFDGKSGHGLQSGHRNRTRAVNRGDPTRPRRAVLAEKNENVPNEARSRSTGKMEKRNKGPIRLGVEGGREERKTRIRKVERRKVECKQVDGSEKGDSPKMNDFGEKMHDNPEGTYPETGIQAQLEMSTGDGLLCDLFPTEPSSHRIRRTINPSKDELNPGPTDAVSCHLFVEENIFL